MIQDEDTLRYQMGRRPGTMRVDISSTPLAVVTSNLSSYMKDSDYRYSEAEAAKFYLYNHIVTEIAKRCDVDEPLGDFYPIVKEYQSIISEQATRIFYYLICICTRESRHTSDSYNWNYAESNYGAGISKFTRGLYGSGSSEAVSALRHSKIEAPLGHYSKHLCEVFFNGKFSTSYGGAPWGMIADTFHRFVMGQISPEILLDTAYTLAHNTGPMFNKGIFYHGQEAHDLIKVLDIQRAGMMPALVLSEIIYSLNSMAPIVEEAMTLMPGVFDKNIDWVRVVELGAIGDYSEQVHEQGYTGKFPTPDSSEAEALQKAKAGLAELYAIPKASGSDSNDSGPCLNVVLNDGEGWYPLIATEDKVKIVSIREEKPEEEVS